MRSFTLLIALALASGCVSTRNADFKSFADAGRANQQKVASLVDEAIASNIDAESQTMLDARELAGKAPPGESGDPAAEIQRRDAAAIQLTRQMLLLKKHASLLDQYFQDLAALAGSNNEAAISASTQKTLAALSELSPDLKKLKIGEQSIPDAAKETLPVLVRGMQVQALENELRKNGGLIDRELRLQEAALELIVGMLRDDTALLAEHRWGVEVAEPYLDAKRELGADWAGKRRETILERSANLPKTAEEALESSRSLRRLFISLVGGGLSAADHHQLQRKILQRRATSRGEV